MAENRAKTKPKSKYSKRGGGGRVGAMPAAREISEDNTGFLTSSTRTRLAIDSFRHLMQPVAVCKQLLLP